jgi:hypothetical protein
MEHLFVRLALLTLVLVPAASGAGSTKTAPKTTNKTIPTAAPAPSARQELYYWYLWPENLFQDENTISAEIYELWVDLDVDINQEPAGGILIEEGYTNSVYPQNLPPSVFLYMHVPLLRRKKP